MYYGWGVSCVRFIVENTKVRSAYMAYSGLDALFSAFCTVSVCGLPLGDGGPQER